MKKAKKQLPLGKKLLLLLLAVALVVGLAYLTYYLLRFTFYNDYKQYLSSYDYEQGTELVLQAETLEGYESFKLALQTDSLKLYLEEKTSNVAIYDKRSGEITFAAPVAADDDALANDKNKNYLKSHIRVDYYNASRVVGTYDSYSMAVNRDQVTYEAIEGGIRVIYDLGDYTNALGIIPWYMTYETFETLSARLSESEAKDLARYYSTESDIAGVRMLIRVARTNPISRAKIQALLEGLGYTEEDCIAEMTAAGAEVVQTISFKIPLEYRLQDDHVDVSVPVSGIEEHGGGAVYRVHVLPNFGAAGADESGYMVVPNGDGSLIHFNNGKTTVNDYSQYVYGIDLLAANYSVVESTNKTTMALFGLSKENATILATIEDGASLANLTASISGKVNSYNNVYATFVLRGSETLSMFGTTGNESELPVVEDAPYNCNLTVRYSFLDDAHTGYSGMAAYYRERLISEGVLTPNAGRDNIKFYYDVISGVEMTEFFLGKQYMSTYPMTTFEEAAQMVEKLTQAGINDQVMNLQGWFNAGYYHDAARYIRLSGKLGSKSELETLNQMLAENGGLLNVDVAFQKVPFKSKYFNYEAESSKYYSGYVASFGQIHPATLRQTSSLGYSQTMYDLISPKFLGRYTGSFAEKIGKYDVAGISLRDLGSQLHSDKKRTNVIDREAALDVVLSQLELLEGTGKNMLVNMANDYAWGIADDIINLPLCDNEYSIVDEDIPLYEMIVHGSIDYCGEVYNLSSSENDRVRVLNMIEYGAAPHFVFTWKETSDMKYSSLNSKYSTTFSLWADTAIEIYDEVNGVLRQVDGETITAHEILQSGIRKIQYSNGVTIYVNYTETDATADGITIPALGYAVR